ncbi:serine/threonine protein kinase [Actinomadura logoneensis]|uniref:non-specific serine/threonine protein kinase n=2 Tax=Actinomadura logoneensis TaxID=2293572 RepID=A0A372JHG4_9ACTN|nr:serine/threonine protein kinase [Actinomadura logoneensis]
MGKGGMGEVWGATDTELMRRVAVKFISFPQTPTEREELVKRFDRECKLTARMDHPGVPALYDLGEETEGRFAHRRYLVMQLIEGREVDDLVAEHDPFPIGWAAAIAAQTCAVLSHAHSLQLVHRDLKPSNLMVDQHGAVKVLDFGLAAALDDDQRSRLTSTGQMVGTIAYMAPEQYDNNWSPRSDLYSLGTVLYEMLSRRCPFAGPTQASIMKARLTSDAVPVRELRRDVPPALERLLQALLDRDPRNRPESADEVYEHLEPHIGDLPWLPDAVRPGPTSVRRYTAIVGRALTTRVARPQSADKAPSRFAAPAENGRPSESFGRGDVDRARRHARRLVGEARYEEAARTMSRITERAERHFGADHTEVMELRRELAEVRFQAGDYRTAAEDFNALVRELSRSSAPDTELVLRLRFQEANSHALAGDTPRALNQLNDLLADERRMFGSDDSRVLELRRQVGLLQFGAGRTASAVHTLEDLLHDLVRLHGPEHGMVRKVRESLDRVKGR